MKLRLLGLGAGLALVLTVLTRGAGGPPDAGRPSLVRAPVSATDAASSVEPDPLPPPPIPLRLVGLVSRAEGLRAAVATASGVVLLGPGDAVSGYVVLGVDEEHGLRLRGPDGVEHVLEPRS